MIILHIPNGDEYNLQVSDNSYRYRKIMGENALTLNFALPEAMDFPCGIFTDFLGERYTLEAPASVKKIHNTYYEYTMILQASQARLQRYKFSDMSGNGLDVCNKK